MTAKKKRVKFSGRLINHSLFVRDRYKDPESGQEGAPMYKAEVCISRRAMDELLEDIAEAAFEQLGAEGEDAVRDGDIRLPFLDGDEIAADREARGKPGDAYKGMMVLRPNTKYNKDGDEGPGGIEVYDEDVEPLDAASREDVSQVYSGCMVDVLCAVSFFKLQDKRDRKDFSFGHGCKFYLVAVQKTGDGERLSQGTNNSSAFGKTGGGTKRRKHEEDEGEEDPKPRPRRRPRNEEDESEEDPKPRPRRRPRNEEYED